MNELKIEESSSVSLKARSLAAELSAVLCFFVDRGF